jgi:hypothetical protein
MALVNIDAQRLNHEHNGTEHFLVGICREGSGIACTPLYRLGEVRIPPTS